jgi:outer membrane murein-binding lipoprotein Lpp
MLTWLRRCRCLDEGCRVTKRKIDDDSDLVDDLAAQRRQRQRDREATAQYSRVSAHT